MVRTDLDSLAVGVSRHLIKEGEQYRVDHSSRQPPRRMDAMMRDKAAGVVGMSSFAVSTGTLVLLLITGSETPRETMAFFALIIGCYALPALCIAAAKRVLLALLSGALAVVSFPLALFIGYVVEMLQSQQ